MAEKTIYYSDPLNDDFADNNINTTVVDKSFPFYSENIFYNIVAWILYYIIAIPIVFLISKIYLGLKIKNRRVLRKIRKDGYFLFCNHTRELDAFLPSMATWPKKSHLIAGPDAVSIPFLRHIVLMLGAIPIPTTRQAMPLFFDTIKKRAKQKRAIMIFPEAHIWPFYTGIRPFRDTSFRYPVDLELASVAMVTTYRRRRGLMAWCKKPAMTVTLSEPFYADKALPRKQAQKKLRDQVYEFMKTTSENSENVIYYEYIQTDTPPTR